MIGVDNIVAAQHRDIRQASAQLSGRAVQVTEDALARVDRQLRRQRHGSWGEAEALATRAQLRAGLAELAARQQQVLVAGLPPIMRAAQGRTADYLRTLDERYLGAVRPLRFDTLAWWEKHSGELGQVRLREFSRSFQRYGAEAVAGVERAIASTVLTGQRWDVARREVWRATADVVGHRQWMVDRILRTEVAAAYNGTNLAALLEEDDPDDPMLKKLVATFDRITGLDSVAVHGQVRPVREPFRDPKGRIYMAPPNRPHDREIVVGWRAAWGEGLPAFDQRTAGADPRVIEAPVDALPPAPPLRVKPPPVAPGRAALARGAGTTAPPRSTPQRAALARLTARRLVVASLLRAALTEAKAQSQLGPTASAAAALADARADQLRSEYGELRIRQALAETHVRLAEDSVVALARVRAGALLDFGGMVFPVSRVDVDGLVIRTPFGPARLPALPVPARVLSVRPNRVVRPRSADDVAALLGILRSARKAA